MELKVGDKVRIVKFPDKDIVGLIGEVIRVDNHPVCPYEVKLVSNQFWVCSMYPSEIEPLIKVGQQLLFSFME